MIVSSSVVEKKPWENYLRPNAKTERMKYFNDVTKKIYALRVIQHFLDRCYKRSYISYPITVLELLQKQDTKIFNTVTTSDDHPLAVIIPKKKKYLMIHVRDVAFIPKLIRSVLRQRL